MYALKLDQRYVALGMNYPFNPDQYVIDLALGKMNCDRITYW